MRLIDADALMKAINDDERGKNIHKMRSGKLLLSIQIILEHLHFAPTIEVERVKHGEWKTTETVLGLCCECSVCGSCLTDEYNYCPNCGAKMRGNTDE